VRVKRIAVVLDEKTRSLGAVVVSGAFIRLKRAASTVLGAARRRPHSRVSGVCVRVHRVLRVRVDISDRCICPTYPRQEIGSWFSRPRLPPSSGSPFWSASCKVPRWEHRRSAGVTENCRSGTALPIRHLSHRGSRPRADRFAPEAAALLRGTLERRPERSVRSGVCPCGARTSFSPSMRSPPITAKRTFSGCRPLR